MSVIDQLVGCSSDKINPCHRRRSDNSLVHGKRWAFMRMGQEVSNDSPYQVCLGVGRRRGPLSTCRPLVGPSIISSMCNTIYIRPLRWSDAGEDQSRLRTIPTFLYTLDATPTPRIVITTPSTKRSVQTVSWSHDQPPECIFPAARIAMLSVISFHPVSSISISPGKR